MQIVKHKEFWNQYKLNNGDIIEIRPIVYEIKLKKNGEYKIRSSIFIHVKEKSCK